MSYTRVLVSEIGMPWSQFRKFFRNSMEPRLDAFKKQKIVSSWSLVQTGDSAALIIFNFPNKAAMNKFLKTMAAVRRGLEEDHTGMQTWTYHGPVKASG